MFKFPLTKWTRRQLASIDKNYNISEEDWRNNGDEDLENVISCLISIVIEQDSQIKELKDKVNGKQESKA